MSGIEATLSGRLGGDPTLRYTAVGAAMLAFGVAVEDDRRRPDEPTQWVRVAIFGDRAEELDGTLTKGDQVTCAGRLVVKLYQGRPDLELYAWDVQRSGARRPIHRRRSRGEPVMLGAGSAGRSGRVRASR